MRAVVLSIALVACGANQPASPALANHAVGPVPDAAVDARPTGGAAAVAKLERLAEAMCQCPDRDCADQIIDEMTQWLHELEGADEAPLQVTSAQGAQARVARTRMSTCLDIVYRRRAGSIIAP